MVSGNPMAKIFLCHASEDKEKVRELYQRLKAEGFEPWLDEEDLLPGPLWDQEIRLALENSDFILIFFSQNSVAKRGYVRPEFKLALDTLQEIAEDVFHTIPIRLDDCEIPEQFKFLFYGDLFEEDGFEKLVQAIRTGLSQPQRQQEFSQRMRELLQREQEFLLQREQELLRGQPQAQSQREFSWWLRQRQIERARQHPLKRARQRYTKIEFPKRCHVNVMATLKIQLKGESLRYTILKRRVRNTFLKVSRESIFSVHVTALAFTVAPSIALMRVPVDQDSDIVVFEMTPVEAGTHVLEIEMFFRSERVGYFTIESEVINSTVVFCHFRCQCDTLRP
jgi:hypothetical protein